MKFLRFLCFLLAMGCTALATAAVPVPTLSRRVTDLTGTLSAGQIGGLEEQLAAFEARKGAQLAVLIVPTTAPETIEQFGIRVVDQWKLGRQAVDDGALLLVAKDDRALRIEVGRGLEGVMPDAIAKRIISEVITPAFRKGDFAGGIDAGLRRMIQVIDGEPLPPPAHRPGASGGTSRLLNFLPFAFLAVPVLGGLLRLLLGRLPAAAVGGLIVAAVLWFISAPLVLIAFIALFVFLFILASGGSGIGSTRGPSSGWSSGGSGSFGSGGGGFSGGGGGFSGGGASGRW